MSADKIYSFTADTLTQVCGGSGNGACGQPGSTVVSVSDGKGDKIILYFADPASGPFTGASSGPGNTFNLSLSTGGGGGYLTISPQTPVAASTPEPSSLVLLSTGVLGLAATVRRRFLKA